MLKFKLRAHAKLNETVIDIETLLTLKWIV